VHSYLGFEWESAGIVYGANASGGFPDDAEDEPEDNKHGLAIPGRRFNPADSAIIVCDEDPTHSLVERWPLRRDALLAITGG
jgi:hypothetical protein